MSPGAARSASLAPAQDPDTTSWLDEFLRDLPAIQMPTPSVKSLHTTNISKAFFDLFHHLGEFPYILSGYGVTTKDSQSSLLAYLQQEQSRIANLVNGFIQPFLDQSQEKDPSFQAIAQVTKRLVSFGYLKSVCKAKLYMVQFGQVPTPNSASTRSKLRCSHGITGGLR